MESKGNYPLPTSDCPGLTTSPQQNRPALLTSEKTRSISNSSSKFVKWWLHEEAINRSTTIHCCLCLYLWSFLESPTKSKFNHLRLWLWISPLIIQVSKITSFLLFNQWSGNHHSLCEIQAFRLYYQEFHVSCIVGKFNSIDAKLSILF